VAGEKMAREKPGQTLQAILVDVARRKCRLKRGGDRVREEDDGDLAAPQRPEWLLDLDEALDRLAATNPQAAKLVQLRHCRSTA
jgi:ECF sigma factor